MKQITEEQGLALIKEFQDKSQSGFSLNDDEMFSFKAQMRDKQIAYLCEASITEPSSKDADRIGKLVQTLKPEIDGICMKPRYFHVQILMSNDASLTMDELNAMNDFMDCYDDIEIKWSLNTIEGVPHTIKMQIITVTE